MNLFGVLFILSFYFAIFIFCKNAKAEKLKLRVIYAQSNPNCQVQLELMQILYYREYGNYRTKEKVHRSIENGKNFEIDVMEGEQSEMFTLGFAVGIWPIRDDFEPLGNGSDDGSSSDDAPFPGAEMVTHSQTDAVAATIGRNGRRCRRRALLAKVVRIDMYRPNFALRHLIDLGSVDILTPLFWSRRVIFEANKDMGNYHAFLYANVDKNGQHHRNSAQRKKTFLGYAPLLKKGAGEGTSTAQHGTSEYQLTIPVKLGNLFKHKLWNLKVYIYQFKELDITGENRGQSPAAIESESDETCPICLELLQFDGRQVIKLHGKGSIYEHKYHADCITKWIESQQNLRCPLCLTDPKLIIVADFAPIFSDSASILYHKLFVNPTAQLFQIANSHEIGPFGHGQALHAFSSIQQKMEQSERRIKKCLATMEVPLLMDKLFGETFFEVGFNGFAERQILANVRHELETIVEMNFTPKMIDQAKEVLKLIKTTREELESEATAVLETIQMISGEEDGQ